MLLESFGLGASAASDNLVDPNLRNWDVVENNTGDVTVKLANTTDSGVCYQLHINGYEIEVNDNTLYSAVGGVYDLSDLKSGNSYTFSMDIMSASQMYINESYYSNIFSNGGTLYIGLAQNATSSEELVFVEDYYTIIDSNNFNQYLGNEFTFTFEMPNVVNPAICIFFAGLTESATLSMGATFGFRDIQLIDNEQAEEDGFFDRLFEFFHDLKWDLIGGVCGGEGCSKSPHTSLADRIGMKLDELKQSFTDLGNDILEGIKSLFIPDEQFIADWKIDIESVLAARLGIIWQAGDFCVSLIQTVTDLLTTRAEDMHYSLPKMEFTLEGKTYVLWEERAVDFSFIETNSFFRFLFGLYKTVLNVSLGIPLINYARKEMDNTLHN